MNAVQESVIEAGFVKRAKKLGAEALKFTSPGRAGVPDRIVLLPCGCTRFVELKAPGEKPRKLQVSTFARFERLGHPVEVIDSAVGVAVWAGEVTRHLATCI